MEDWKKESIQRQVNDNKRKDRTSMYFALGVIVVLVILNLIFNWTRSIGTTDNYKPYDNRGVYIDQDN